MALTQDFEGLPLGLLVCQPILEVAKGQAELCNVYLDNLFKLAFKTMPDTDKEDAVEARVVKFNLNRTVVDSSTGSVKPVTYEVEAPLLSLVPVPAFTMDETTVRFTMEVKESASEKNDVSTETGFQASYGLWGFKANISGKVSTQSENTRSSDKSAKYEIYARAAQQPPAEGMSKLTDLFASIIEPIEAGAQ